MRESTLRQMGTHRSSHRFYAAEVFYKSTRSKGIGISIPTHTYAHDAYPRTRSDNRKRCRNAVYDVTFKGAIIMGKARERVALKRFVGKSGFVIEYSEERGEKSERMANLLHKSRFGLVPQLETVCIHTV